MADAPRLQESIDITDAWGGKAVDATVFGCHPDIEQRNLRDRATLALYMGCASVRLQMTHAECLALAALITKAAETIPEGLRS